jgi:hypothetical protein
MGRVSIETVHSACHEVIMTANTGSWTETMCDTLWRDQGTPGQRRRYSDYATDWTTEKS